MRVLFVAAEMFPLAKTGGLGDVCAALPRILTERGADLKVMIPGYPQALQTAVHKRVVAEFTETLGIASCRIIAAETPDTNIPVLLVDCPALYQRAGGIYQDSCGRDWADNAQRFAVLCRLAAKVALGRLGGWQPDVLHLHDWCAGLVPAYLALHNGRKPATLFTIHNLAFQGLFPGATFPSLGLAGEMFSPEGLEFYGQVSFLKAGIRYSDKLTTVSPTYAREILTPDYGCGLDGLLRLRADDLVGILNGVDELVWSPSNNPHLPEGYDDKTIQGKEVCKSHVQRELGLSEEPRPLIGIINRLTRQKMADTVAASIAQITARGAQVAVLGDGEHEIERALLAGAADHPGRAAVRIGYQEPLAHRLFAGADVVLSPAQFEPCGLTPMYAMRYGALPVVRRTGGMANSVTPTNHETQQERATGFSFDTATSEGMLACLFEALDTFRLRPRWQEIQAQAMKRDCSWTNSVSLYLKLYNNLCCAMGRRAAQIATEMPCA